MRYSNYIGYSFNGWIYEGTSDKGNYVFTDEKTLRHITVDYKTFRELIDSTDHPFRRRTK